MLLDEILLVGSVTCGFVDHGYWRGSASGSA